MPVVVLFNLLPSFLNATYRHFLFMVKGLEEVQETLHEVWFLVHQLGVYIIFLKHAIPFVLTRGADPAVEIAKFVEEHNVSAVVTDFSPLRIARKWKADLVEKCSVPVYEGTELV